MVKINGAPIPVGIAAKNVIKSVEGKYCRVVGGEVFENSGQWYLLFCEMRTYGEEPDLRRYEVSLTCYGPERQAMIKKKLSPNMRLLHDYGPFYYVGGVTVIARAQYNSIECGNGGAEKFAFVDLNYEDWAARSMVDAVMQQMQHNPLGWNEHIVMPLTQKGVKKSGLKYLKQSSHYSWPLIVTAKRNMMMYGHVADVASLGWAEFCAKTPSNTVSGGVVKYAKFDGEIYECVASYKTEPPAKKLARQYRKRGFRARYLLICGLDGLYGATYYAVYVRKAKK